MPLLLLTSTSLALLDIDMSLYLQYREISILDYSHPRDAQYKIHDIRLATRDRTRNARAEPVARQIVSFKAAARIRVL